MTTWPGDGDTVPTPGSVVILNGPPRSGKSSIAAAVVARSARSIASGRSSGSARSGGGERRWFTTGVDHMMAGLPERYRPGIGLRPGGERPDLEPFVVVGYRALWETAASFARWGTGVVIDVGVHDDHSDPLDLWADLADRLDPEITFLVGVRCELDEVLRRRAARPDRGTTRYVTADGEGEVPAPVRRWDDAVHRPGRYDLEVDTTTTRADDCAATILRHVETRAPTALHRLRAERSIRHPGR